MLYDELAIKRIGERKIWESIKNRDSYSLTSKSEDMQLMIRAVESYIVKYYDKFNPQAKKRVDELVDSIFTIYSKHPHMATYSEILSNPHIVEYLTKDNSKRKKMYSMASAELQKDFKKIYTRIMSKQQVSEEDKDRLYAFFILHLKSNKKDNTIDTCMKHIADKILKANQVPTNEQEKLFIMNYVAKETLKINHLDDENVTIRLVDLGTKIDDGFKGGHEQNGFINMNSNISNDKTFYNSLHQILQCVSRETVHRIQEIEAIKEPQSIHGMEMAFQNLFMNKDYLRGHNYIFNEIEEDADERGFSATSLIYYRAGNKKIESIVRKEGREKHERRKLHIEYVTTTENGKEIRVTKEKYNTENIRRIVKQNKDLIKQYDNNHKNKNSDLYGTYEYRIRMLMNTIDEHKNKNTLGYLEEPLKKYEPNLRKFDYDIRRDYMEYIKSHFTKEELETRVHFDSRAISLKRFIDEDIFKHMDRNHYLHKNDGMYVKSSDGTVVVSITKFVREILEKCSIKTTKYSKELNDMFDYQEPTTSTTKQTSIVA